VLWSFVSVEILVEQVKPFSRQNQEMNWKY